MSNNNCCAICCQVDGQKNGDLLCQLLDGEKEYVRRVILESENYVVFPSVGPLKLGHVILCPKPHYSSFACLPKDFEKEYEAMKAQLQHLLENAFEEDIHIFEHGSDAESLRIPCSVEHAHQHFLPANIDILHALRDGITWEPIQPSIASLSHAVGGREYLFYQNPKGNAILATAGKEGFESQYIRKVVANALGKSNQWNWRTHPLSLDIEKTFVILSSASAKTGKTCNDYLGVPMGNVA